MTERADVVVIGAGLGGLACAADLASRGLFVIVLERHGLVGGYASSFTRGPYVFDVSQHAVGGLGRGQSFFDLLDRIGVAADIEVATPAHLATIIFPDRTLTLPGGHGAAVEMLAGLDKAERDALGRLLEECESIHRDTVAGALDSDMRRLIRGMRLAGDRTFGQVLDASISSRILRTVLSLPWVLLGLPPSRAAYSWFAKVLTTTLIESTGHIVGGGQALASAMAARIRHLGGEVRTSLPATSILTKDGVTGVETQAGDVIETSTVVASIDPWALAGLLNDERWPDPAGEPSLSMAATYLGLDVDPASLGIPEGASFITATGDAEAAYRASLRGAIDEADIVLSSPTALDPGCAPPGKGMIHAVALVNGRPWFDLSGGTYASRKRQVQAAMIDRLEAHFPGLGGAVKVVETATPRTMHGYTRNHLGAVYGLAQTVTQSGARRPGASTPIPGLHRTGAWVLPGGGYSAATLSGLMTSREVARRLGLKVSSSHRKAEDRFLLRIFYEDTDTDGLTYHVSYMRFFDRARTEMFMTMAKKEKIALPRAVVTHIDVRYHHPSTLGDAIEIVTLARFASDYRVVFEQEARLARDGTPLAEATTEMAFVDGDGSPVPCPVREQLERPLSGATVSRGETPGPQG